MKKSVIGGVIVLAAGLLAPRIAQAQGTLYVSNLGQTPTGSSAVGSDSWIAQAFEILTTDPNSYRLDSIQISMNPASGNSSGFAVSIYATSAGAPQTDLGVLSGPDPASGGTFSYTASGITLSGGGRYFVVATATAPLAQGSYNWNSYLADGVTQNGTWSIDNGYYTSSDGSGWVGHARQNVFQMAIFATPAPEPGAIGLFALGGLLVAFQRRKAKSLK